MPSSEAPKGAANEARSAEVLAAAFDVFVERGYKSATVQDIASRVGLLKGSLYYYIESKEALLFALIKRAYENIGDYLNADPELLEGDATTRLCRFIELFIGNMSSNVSEAEARLVRQEMHHLTAAHRREIRIRAEIVQGIEERDFDPDTDPAVAVHSIFSILNNVSWHLRRGEQSWDAIVAWYKQFMVKGLGGQPVADSAALSLALDAPPLT
jgi:TetR/AcrR family transcriptional regulator, cholesterol catabolism regulator